MKAIFAALAVLAAGVWTLEAAPLAVLRTETFRPESRPGVEFKSWNNTYLVKVDEKTGSFGRWSTVYQVPAGAAACRFQARHNAGKDAAAKALIVCSVNWLDAGGKILQTAAMEPDKDGVLTCTLRRPAGAEQAAISMGVRYFYREVTFKDVVCEPVEMPSRKVRIIAAKITPAGYSRASCADNQDRMEYVLTELVRVGEKPDLVIFPETLLTRWVRNLGVGKGAQSIPGPHTDWAAGWAKKLNTNMVVSLREMKDGRCYNSAVVIDRKGKIVGVYRKTQLTIGEYGNAYDWGTELPVFELDFGKIGMLICWDMWFPEAVRMLRLRGAEILAYPIASTSRPHYDRMWRTRAMENGMVIAGAISGGDTCPSQIVSQDGEILSEAYYQQTYAAATVDLAELPARNPAQVGKDGIFCMPGRHPAMYRGLSDLEGVAKQGKK